MILLPVIIIGSIYLKEFYQEHYTSVSQKRVTGFILSILLFYGWVFILALKRRQDSFFQGLVLSSFFVYVFVVLILTGYFILFREVSSLGWTDRMLDRVNVRDRVNLEPFKIFKVYTKYDRQVLGNIFMLLPLGIYLPLIYQSFRKGGGFFWVLLISFIASVLIELMQLATRFRSADIDDVILNIAGACVGYVIYQLINGVITLGKANKIEDRESDGIEIRY